MAAAFIAAWRLWMHDSGQASRTAVADRDPLHISVTLPGAGPAPAASPSIAVKKKSGTKLIPTTQ